MSTTDDCEFCVKCGAMYPTSPGVKTQAVHSTTMASDPLERGFQLLQADSFADGILAWLEAFKDGGDVDDDTYRRMITECTGCMLRIVMSREEYARSRIYDLAVSIDDRELITDLMSELVANKGVCTVQTGMLGLLSEYMLLFIDCFAVYTDLRDLKTICENSSSDMEPFFDLAPTLPAPDGMKQDWGFRWVENYREFIFVVRDAVQRTMDSMDESRMDALSDYWASMQNLSYKNHLLNALMMNIQLFKAGRFTGKMFIKGRDMEIAEAFRKYSSPRINGSEEV